MPPSSAAIMRSPLLVAAAAAAVLLSTPVAAATGIQKFLETWKKGPLVHYPTDFTRGILPVCSTPREGNGPLLMGCRFRFTAIMTTGGMCR